MKRICWMVIGAVCVGIVGANVQAENKGGSEMELLYIKETTHSVDVMEERLKASAKNHQFSILNVTDLRAKLQSNDLDFTPACKVFDVCNPHRAKEVLDNKLEISTALPCRISVYEKDGETKVATLLPSKVLGMFGAEGLDSVAESVETDLIAIINEAITTQ